VYFLASTSRPQGYHFPGYASSLRAISSQRTPRAQRRKLKNISVPSVLRVVSGEISASQTAR